MSLLNNKQTQLIKHYDILLKTAERKILASFRSLNIDSFSYEGKHRYTTTYYDTPENLLTKAGILMYKTWENGSYYIKIDRISIVASNFMNKNEVFTLKIDPKDTPIVHSFYLINGISNLFSTQFSIDLEHVIKAVVPKITIEIESTLYKAFSGTGFKCNLAFEDCKYKNFETKRKNFNKELVVTFDSPGNFIPEFETFCQLLEKYCKEILPKKERRYVYAKRITQPINKENKNKVIKEKKIKDKKGIRLEDKID